MSDERYVVATVVSTHRMRYAIPVSKMETEEGVPLSMTEASVIEYVNDSVTCEEAKEFSQKWFEQCVALSCSGFWENLEADLQRVWSD